MSLSFLILLFFLTLTFFVESYASWDPMVLSIFSVSSTFHRFPLILSYSRPPVLSPFVICTLALLHSLLSSFAHSHSCTLSLHHLHARLPPLVFLGLCYLFFRLLLFEPFQILCKYKHFLNRFKVFFHFFASPVLRHQQIICFNCSQRFI